MAAAPSSPPSSSNTSSQSSTSSSSLSAGPRTISRGQPSPDGPSVRTMSDLLHSGPPSPALTERTITASRSPQTMRDASPLTMPSPVVVPLSPPTMPRSPPLELTDLRQIIDQVRDQTNRLLDAQRETNDMLDLLHRRPTAAPVDHDLERRKIQTMANIEALVNQILDTLDSRDQQDLLDRLQRITDTARPRERPLFAPSPQRSHAPSFLETDRYSTHSWQGPPPPPPSDLGMPERTPMIIRAPARPQRPRSASPVLPDLNLPRSYSAPPPGAEPRSGSGAWLPPIRRRTRHSEREPSLDEGLEEEYYDDDDLSSETISLLSPPTEDGAPGVRPRHSRRRVPADDTSSLIFERLIRDRRRAGNPAGDGIFVPSGGATPRPSVLRPGQAANVPHRISSAPPAVAPPVMPIHATPRHGPGQGQGLWPTIPMASGGLPMGIQPGFAMPPPQPPAVIVPVCVERIFSVSGSSSAFRVSQFPKIFVAISESKANMQRPLQSSSAV
ncbi:hypothetical protein BKA62DRAFT_172950 [Auriculariales sp. MPI-PUGE-AT-0066]|nr:hypothetical protein BKA62DRAFT_172950 [Auriculariales sp. MPI-PUGE-AT-0066]